jgi:AraC-like DNA-binding protein
VQVQQLGETILQFGADGGAGIVHGVTDPNFTTAIIQTTGFDSRVLIDGVPCQASDMVVLPPDCHFTFVRFGHLRWVAWTIPNDVDIAKRIVPTIAGAGSFRTSKHLANLSPQIASEWIGATDNARRAVSASTPADRPRVMQDQEEILMDELAYVWDSRLSETKLPKKLTTASERIVMEALEFVRARPESIVQIEDIVRAIKVEYRTLLRAFERYLGLSPKHYLMLRQINLVYHAIRREGADHDRIADILAAHGVTEFGRFAGHYKSLFGELPSETHQRLHALRRDDAL